MWRERKQETLLNHQGGKPVKDEAVHAFVEEEHKGIREKRGGEWWLIIDIREGGA